MSSGVLAALRGRGVTLSMNGDRLCYRGPRGVIDDDGLVEILRRHKPQLMAELQQEQFWEEFWEYVDERAAIMEFDGGLPRHKAEAKARSLVTQQFDVSKRVH